MLIYNNGEVSIIRNGRIELEEIIGTHEKKIFEKKYKIFIDGEFFIESVIMFLEHKQYLLFEKNYSQIDFATEFNGYTSIVFCDLGTTDATKDINNVPSGAVFRDYTEKGKEGISYFSDILIDGIRNDSFKSKYVRIGEIV